MHRRHQEPRPADGKRRIERTSPTFDPVRATARQAGSIGELLDAMWERDRNDAPPPYISVSQLRVMYIVDRENGIRMRALTRLSGVAPRSVGRLLPLASSNAGLPGGAVA
ncbi:hypothetical protein [Streptomyces mirabilis]|uniref:hypothetical protein n=1 Tax=Streptomyces mirabilis TaxID=68239 RepID=UPI0036744AD6